MARCYPFLLCCLLACLLFAMPAAASGGDDQPMDVQRSASDSGTSGANAELAGQIRGTWAAGQLTVTLDVDSQGGVSGTVAIEGGTTLQVQGELAEGVAVGTCQNAEAWTYFQASPDGDGLTLIVVDPDAQGQPNYETAQEIKLQRQGSGSGMDLAGPAASGKSDSEQLLGTWACQGMGQEPVELIFTSENKLVFDGEEEGYTLVDGAVRLQGETGPIDFPYVLSGNTLVVTFPDGERYTFIKTSDDVAQGIDRHIRFILLSSGWQSFNFSSSSSTTYQGGEGLSYSYGSSQYRKMYFYPDGTYSHTKTSETSFSGSGSQSGLGSMAGASGGSGTAGRWKVENGNLYLAQGADSFRKVDFWIFCNTKSNVNAPSRTHPKGSEPFYYVEGSTQCRCGGWPIVVIFGNEYTWAE
jgi:hypothetical protein